MRLENDSFSNPNSDLAFSRRFWEGLMDSHES
jgi:hypothetical protein